MATYRLGLRNAPSSNLYQHLVQRCSPSPSFGLQQVVALQTRRSRRPCVTPKAVFDDKNQKDYGDRVIASLSYMLPLLDAVPYGKYIFVQYPFVARALAPLAPLTMLYNSFPFAPFLVFLAVYSGIVNNYNFGRFIRYNAMQAVLLDILLIIPQVILTDVFKQPTDSLGIQAYITAFNTIFLFVAVCVAYGMGSCLVGQTARLPMVAEAADTQVRDGPSGW